MSIPVVFLILLSVMALVGLVAGIGASTRRASRWFELLDHAVTGEKPASLLRAQWIQLGACRFKGCDVKVALSGEGLYLSPGAGVPSDLLIPWDEVREDGRGGFLLGKADVPLLVRDSLARRIRGYLRQDPKVVATATDPTRCPYCHAGLEGGPVGACVACGTQHHAECLVEHGGCAVQGCERAPEREQRADPKTRA